MCLHVLSKFVFFVLLVTHCILLSLNAELINWPKIFGQKINKLVSDEIVWRAEIIDWNRDA